MKTVSMTPITQTLFNMETVRQHCNIDPSDIAQDALLIGFLAAATEEAERHTGQTINPITVVVEFEEAECNLTLPWQPVASVTSVLVDGQAVSYEFDSFIKPYPVIRFEEPPAGVVQVTFVAGYLADPGLGPLLTIAIRSRAAASFKDREGVDTKNEQAFKRACNKARVNPC